MNDKAISVKIQSLDALRTTKDKSVVSQLLKLIETVTIANQMDANVQLLNKSIKVLSEIGSPANSPELVSILMKTRNMIKASKIIEILGYFGAPSSIPSIVACLKTQELCGIATEVLPHFGEAAIPDLEQLMNDGKRGVRKIAEQIVAKIKSTPRK